MPPETDRRLTDRRALILRAIVSHYVGTGEPVGSKVLVERYQLGVSPATVRNEMAALEDGGYIYQPHTSAGRIPTDAGYRYFVDEMPEGARLPAAEAHRIRQFFIEPRWELEEALRQTASLLSSLTNHAAVVFAPALDRSLVKHVELIALAGERAMLIAVTDTGRVENQVVRVPEGTQEGDLLAASDALNKVLGGIALEDAAATIRNCLGELPQDMSPLLRLAADAFDAPDEDKAHERFFLEGTSNIVDEAKFSDLESVRRVISALEHRRLLLEVLADAFSLGGVSVRIGAENQSTEMRLCSVVTAPYGTGDSNLGSLGIVGPTRMDYRRTIAAVHEVSSHLGQMLAGLGID
ncbi:MAG TPA: heat-inducible transcriptional repressor HrcA [Actinomycetota bacterium]|nr:heat-inducible transcriptional repressor HrcA [Actinomycetota bacterium]